jgi:hypothetical protein
MVEITVIQNGFHSFKEFRSNKSNTSTMSSFKYLIDNRGFFAKVAGMAIVPSQFTEEDSNQIVRDARNHSRAHPRLPRIHSFTTRGDTMIHGVVIYPPHTSGNKFDSCILYHNPNAVTVAQHLQTKVLASVPAQLLEMYQVPIILYDYRGVGLSRDVDQSDLTSTTIRFRPTYKSVVDDGLTALQYSLDMFGCVNVWGGSLGGAVATISTDQHLTRFPASAPRLTLFNLDSFTTTCAVVWPNWSLANLVGNIFGGLMDAESAMKRVIEAGIKVTILCHAKDPVIPAGARIADAFRENPSVEIIDSPEYGHANLSNDMVRMLAV